MSREATAPATAAGAGRPRRRRVLRPDTEAGAYARVVAWRGRAAWVEAVRAYAEGQRWRIERREGLVSVAEVLAGYAEHGTGRDVAVALGTVAGRLGLSVRTVRRRVADLAAAGFVVTVTDGRHLGGEERAAARRVLGRRIVARAAVRALTVGDVSAYPDLVEVSGNPPQVQITNAPRRATKRKRDGATRMPRSLGAQRTAAEVIQAWPWLAPGGRQHVGAVVALVERHGLAGMRGADVIGAVDRWHVAEGRAALGRAAMRPVAWLGWALGAVAEVARREASQRAAEAVERAERAAHRRVEAEAAEARRASVTGEGLTAARAALAAVRGRRAVLAA